MDQLYILLEATASKGKLTRTEKQSAVRLFDEILSVLGANRNPPGFKLATGELAKGATGRIALNAYF